MKWIKPLFIMVIVVLLLGSIVYLDNDEEDEPYIYKDYRFARTITLRDWDYHIQITHGPEKAVEHDRINYPLSDIIFELVSPSGSVETTEDYSGGRELKGWITEIEPIPYPLSDHYYESANDTNPLNETERYDSEWLAFNLHWHIVFVDLNQNDIMDEWDYFMLKSWHHGGKASRGDVLRLTFDLDWSYDIELPGAEFGYAEASVIDDDYQVDLKYMPPIDITDTKYQLLDKNGTIKTMENGRWIYNEVDPVTALNYHSNQSFYEYDNDTNPLNESWEREPYYHVAFVDVQRDYSQSEGDYFRIRSMVNGGHAEPGDIFRVISDHTRNTIFEVTLP